MSEELLDKFKPLARRLRLEEKSEEEIARVFRNFLDCNKNNTESKQDLSVQPKNNINNVLKKYGLLRSV